MRGKTKCYHHGSASTGAKTERGKWKIKLATTKFGLYAGANGPCGDAPGPYWQGRKQTIPTGDRRLSLPGVRDMPSSASAYLRKLRARHQYRDKAGRFARAQIDGPLSPRFRPLHLQEQTLLVVLPKVRS